MHRPLLIGLGLGLGLGLGPVARAAPLDPAIEAAAAAFDAEHDDLTRSRRRVTWALLGGGLFSVAAGVGLLVPDADDQAWRFAGGTVLAFGVIDTLLAALALPADARADRRFHAEAASRRTAAGLDRARRDFLRELDREAVAYAINLGLDAAYAVGGAVAIAASQLGVEGGNRWLATGIAASTEALFLVGVDTAGLLLSRRAHDRAVTLLPTLSVAPAPGSPALSVGLRGSF